VPALFAAAIARRRAVSGRDRQSGPGIRRITDSLPDTLAGREAFGCLTSHCQLALRLHYLDGYSIPEIAAQLHITPAYAKKLVSRCLRQARERYGKDRK
jgi:DNA-directed RNA polymerase specialized sigma24 family protein